ncbi:MAG: AAA family ATPase, partial [Bacteroidales bacterium]|nr:AAA family ATPase [Bacteroidales bacterium]
MCYGIYRLTKKRNFYEHTVRNFVLFLRIENAYNRKPNLIRRMTLTPQQKQAIDLIEAFIGDKGQSVFILKGYAGTGKTTLIKNIIPIVESNKKTVSLMAPTGRAAKVMHKKTGREASTIHRGIYSFDRMLDVCDETDELILTGEDSDYLQFRFSLRWQHDDKPENMVYIIDEASMISSQPNNNETVHFGTDILIDDLLTYVQPHSGGKIIFVGDPAQLPPVGDNRSVALDEAYFKERNLSVKSFELTEVFRQTEENVILKDAMMIRDLLNCQQRNELCFERKEGEVEDILPEEIVDSFYARVPEPNMDASIILCYTNSRVKDYNDALRKLYFPEKNNVVAGDILQIVRNNVNKNIDTVLLNGDFVRVIEVSDKVETLSAPVGNDADGERKRISLDFRDVVLQTDEGEIVRCKIIDTLLNSRQPNLTPLQSKALYIIFLIQHPGLDRNTEAFRDALMRDPYFTAIQVKFGYACTVHKSQGGEWKTVYVDYTGRTGLDNDSLRWAYTATTRAVETLYGVNMPNITPMTYIQFGDINRLSRPAKEAFSYADIGDVGFLPTSAEAFRKQKCVCVKERLDAEGFLLTSIQQLQYNDRYTVELPSGTVVVDCYYNATGQYTRFMPNPILPENQTILSIFENEEGVRFKVDYRPTEEA